MAEEKKIVSWEELGGVEDAMTKMIKCENLSEALGQDLYVKIRPIDAIELIKAYNFPMAEIEEMTRADADGSAVGKALAEHAKAFTVTELMDTVKSVVRVGLVEPKPTEGNVEKLGPDLDFVFTEIVALSMPKDGVSQAARFPADGK